MAGTAEGQLQGSRSDINPSYLLSGDAGTQGGGTLQSSDTDNLLRNYEDVFGPAARDIKLDTQRHKRHQRWHLPDAFPLHLGSAVALGDRLVHCVSFA